MSDGIACRLFSGPDIRDCFSSRESDLLSKVDCIPDTLLIANELEDLIAEYVEMGKLVPPRLDLSDTHICEQGKTQIDVRNDPYRLILDDSKPALVDGQFVVIAFPLTGNATLLEYCPVTHGFHTQNASIRDQTVEWYIEDTPAIKTEVLKEEQRRFTSNLEKAVESITTSVYAFNDQLKNRITERMKTKRQEAVERRERSSRFRVACQTIRQKCHQDGGSY